VIDCWSIAICKGRSSAHARGGPARATDDERRAAEGRFAARAAEPGVSEARFAAGAAKDARLRLAHAGPLAAIRVIRWRSGTTTSDQPFAGELTCTI